MYLATFVNDYSSLSVVCPIKAYCDVAGVTMDVIMDSSGGVRV